MIPFQNKISKLAFQVDRRILSLEEEAHFRLDLLAHERAAILVPADSRKKLNLNPNLNINLNWFKNYAIMALLIFSLMFMVSNLPSYLKLGQASLASIESSQIESVEVEMGVYIAKDAWTGSKVGNFAPSVETLTAKEQLEIRPDDGILAIAPIPSSLEDRISIPSLNINAPLVEPSLGLEAIESEDWNELEDQIRESLLQGVVHYPGTANPGKKGNFFVTGHSSNVFWENSMWNTVFAMLPQIEVGTEIIVTKDQEEFVYVVTEKKEVSPKEVAILKQGDGYQMTLMTCTPVGTTLNRLVVTAELKQ
ncbi:MAG: LPXTG-site transpeptidase (sortase) family protein [Oceanicoccus sp.]|jgi:LPXTG-site transpeptidase (sortase) family protein